MLSGMAKHRPIRLLVASLLAAVLTLSGCHRDIVPQLSEKDLRAAYFLTALDELPTDDVLRKITRDPKFCIDLHYGGTTFSDDRQLLSD